MTKLSLEAQAALAAFQEQHELCGPFDGNWQEQCIAAVIRAIANQVTPHAEVLPQKNLESRREAMIWGMLNQSQLTRCRLLAITHELENAPND
jgi:hypothetical protein